MSEVEEKLKLLAALARRCEGDANFMAHALAQFRRQRGLNREDEAALARELGATPEALARLALCRRPDAGAANDGAEVARQVSVIAMYSGVPAERVAALLRAAEAEAEAPTPDAVAVHRVRVRRAWRRFAALFNRQAGLAPRPAWVWAVAAGLLLLAVSGGLLWGRRRGPEMTERAHIQPSLSAVSAASSAAPAAPLPSVPLPAPPAPASSTEPDAVEVAVNLARLAPLSRAADSGAPRPIRLTARLTRLRLTLPPGLPAGKYEVAVVNPDLKPLVTAGGSSRDGRQLRATLNLSRLRTGRYLLQVGRKDEAPLYYALSVEK